MASPLSGVSLRARRGSTQVMLACHCGPDGTRARWDISLVRIIEQNTVAMIGPKMWKNLPECQQSGESLTIAVCELTQTNPSYFSTLNFCKEPRAQWRVRKSIWKYQIRVELFSYELAVNVNFPIDLMKLLGR